MASTFHTVCFADGAGRLAVEMAREGGLVATLALADLLEESGREYLAEGVRAGRLVPLISDLGDLRFYETPDDDPAVVGGDDYIDLSY